MIYIKNNDVVIVHFSPYTISVLTREQAQNFGFDMQIMKVYEKSVLIASRTMAMSLLNITMNADPLIITISASSLYL